jgi:uncharacterized SAM-dependent methyltransferase
VAFKLSDWKVIGEYVFDEAGGRHQAFYTPIRDTVVMDVLIPSHERIKVEQSLKYSPTEAERLWNLAGLTEVDQWKHRNEYGKHGSMWTRLSSPSNSSLNHEPKSGEPSCPFPFQQAA